MASQVNGNINQLYRNANVTGRSTNAAGGPRGPSAKGKDKVESKSQIFGTGLGASATVEFSPEVEMYGRVVDMLQKKYENADVFVAGPGDDLSQIGGDLEYSIILSEDEIKLLASNDEKDKEAKNKLLGQIDDAMKSITEMGKKIGESTDDNDEIANFGISFDKNGRMNFFADINGNSYSNNSLDSIVKSLLADKTAKTE